MQDEITYEELPKEVSFENFSYTAYHHGERDILKPQLEALGYTQISFMMGERDSFGPLSRIIHATDKDGNFHRFVYG